MGIKYKGSSHRLSVNDLLASVEANSNGCFIWKKAKSIRGYGIVSYNGKQCFAHRIMAMFSFGFDLNSKNFICHKCDTRDCINPDHLYIGDAFTNGRDKKERGQSLGKRKLKYPLEMYNLIKDLKRQGFGLPELSETSGISATSIRSILLKK